MARFIYVGELDSAGLVKTLGPTINISLHLKDGKTLTLEAIDKINGFKNGEDLGADVQDSRALRALRADPRFKEV